MKESERIKIHSSRSSAHESSSVGMIQDLKDLKEMAYREFLLLSRYKVSFFSGMFQIVLVFMILILGMVTFVNAGSDSSSTISRFSGSVFYSMTIFLLFSSALWDIGNAVNEKQLSGVLESHFLAPTRYWVMILSPILTSMIWTLSAATLSFIVIFVTLGPIPMENIVLGAIVLVFTYGVIFGIAAMIAALAVHMKQGTNLVINLLQLTSLIVSAMGFPFSVLPKWVLYISRIVPLSYGVDLFRNVMIGHLQGTELLPWEWELVLVMIFGVVLPIIGTWLFSFSIKKAKEKGSLTTF